MLTIVILYIFPNPINGEKREEIAKNDLNRLHIKVECCHFFNVIKFHVLNVSPQQYDKLRAF